MPGTGTYHDSVDETQRRLQVPANAVRVGDTIVHTSKLNKEYRFEVAAVDSDWITFETGQKVHADRFESDRFEVVRPDPTGSGVEERSDDAQRDPSESSAITAVEATVESGRAGRSAPSAE